MSDPQSRVDGADLVTVASFNSLAEAGVARGALEAEGIPAFTADVETASMDWRLVQAVGWIKLQVPKAQAEQAVRVIEAARRLDAARREAEELQGGDPLASSGGDERCLACNAILPESETVCPACGWSYVAENDSVGENDSGPNR